MPQILTRKQSVIAQWEDIQQGQAISNRCCLHHAKGYLKAYSTIIDGLTEVLKLLFCVRTWKHDLINLRNEQLHPNVPYIIFQLVATGTCQHPVNA